MHRIMFQFGSFTLYAYGLFVAAAFFLSGILVLREARRAELSTEAVFDCLIAILAGGLVGGRLLFVIINIADYSTHPLKALMINEGGLAFHGALAGAVIAGAVAARVKKLLFWKTSDLVAPYVALGQAVGRIGCFFNGCCYGGVIESGIGVTFPGEDVMRIPAQIYSSLVLLGIFVILLTLKKKTLFSGYIFVSYLILYSFFRFFLDFTRADNPAIFLDLQLSQIISIGMFLGGIVLYVVLKNTRGHGSNT